MLEGKRVYICSPLSAETQEQRLFNMGIAKAHLDTISQIFNCRSFASHAYLPLMLDDTIAEERKLALSIGKQLLNLCGILVICGRRISSGMADEISYAFDAGKEVYWLNGEEEPVELQQIANWEELEYAVQISENHFS